MTGFRLIQTALHAVALLQVHASEAPKCDADAADEINLIQLRGKAGSNNTIHIPGYCAVMRKACKIVFSEAASSEIDCQLDVAEADAVCETVGAGPEDPFADACVVAFTGAIEVACTAAVKKGEDFGANQCDNAVGCAKSCKSHDVGDGQECTGGDDDCCNHIGSACGRFSNDGEKYQCCNNFAVVNGVAWCQNGVRGQCSDGNNNNCADGVCGRYNNNGNSYQCCSSNQVVDGVAWCANPEGGSCSDGENNNCLAGACGKWSGSTSGYACCTDYTTPGGVATCTSV